MSGSRAFLQSEPVLTVPLDRVIAVERVKPAAAELSGPAMEALFLQIVVGDRARVAACSVVPADVPSDTTVAGIPAPMDHVFAPNSRGCFTQAIRPAGRRARRLLPTHGGNA